MKTDDLESRIRQHYSDREFKLLMTRLQAGIRAVADLRRRLPAKVFNELVLGIGFLGLLDDEQRADVEWLVKRLCGAPDDAPTPAPRHILRLIQREQVGRN